MNDLKLNYRTCLKIDKSKKKNFTYFMLYRDYGYKTEVFSFDLSFIAEALGISVAELRSLELGTYIIK